LPPKRPSAKPLLEYALNEDDRLRQIGEEDRIENKTVFYQSKRMTKTRRGFLATTRHGKRRRPLPVRTPVFSASTILSLSESQAIMDAFRESA